MKVPFDIIDVYNLDIQPKFVLYLLTIIAEDFCIDDHVCDNIRNKRGAFDNVTVNPKMGNKIGSSDVQSKNAATDRRESDMGGNRSPTTVLDHVWPGGIVFYRVDPQMSK